MQNNMLDIMHRRYMAYLEAIDNDTDGQKLRRLILANQKAGEFCNSVLSTCEIETDWLDQIEAALPFIERAVNENRQFILRQGDTVPIEKVRRISKASVEHLARHSQLITKEPMPGEDIIPEKMLMTENISTFAVYENRFLYMLLCYVKDFAEIKHSKITELANFFSSEIVFEKSLSEKNKKISFSLKYKETSKETPLTDQAVKAEACLLRIKNILAAVDTLLKTGLMIEVATAPLLKPPISRTNVLLQNPCFSAAMELYDYLSAYTGDGYTVKELFKHEGELAEDARADYAELVAITSYFAYRHGGLLDELEERYQIEELARQEEARKAKEDHIRALKEQLKDLDPLTTEYILALEDKCKDVESIRSQLYKAQTILEAVEKDRMEAMNLRTALLQEMEQLKKEAKRQGEMERLNAEKHRREMDAATLLIHQKEDEIQRMTASHEAALQGLTQQFRAEYALLAEKYHLQSARLHSLKAPEGVLEQEVEDFSSKEAFAQLEAEYRAFKRFFEAQWKSAKKQIRRDQLWKKTDQ